MTKLNGQAGKTAEAFAIVPMDIVEGVTKCATDQIRRAANRHLVATNATAIDAKCKGIAEGVLWKDGKGDALQESTKEEILLAMREALIDSVVKYYRPDQLPLASPLTYGSKAAETVGRKQTAIAFDMRKRGKSIDAPLGSGSSDENGDSRPRTLGDSLATPLFGRLPLRTQVDLLLVKEHLTKREWEVFFEMRYARYMEHTDIARAFGWTESRYRWFWGKLKKKLMVLTDHRRHPCARQH